MYEVAHVFVCSGHRLPMRELECADDREYWVARVRHARAGSKRQILMIDLETLGRFGLEPGIVKENVTIRGLDLREAAEGQRCGSGRLWLRSLRRATIVFGWMRFGVGCRKN